MSKTDKNKFNGNNEEYSLYPSDSYPKRYYWDFHVRNLSQHVSFGDKAMKFGLDVITVEKIQSACMIVSVGLSELLQEINYSTK